MSDEGTRQLIHHDSAHGLRLPGIKLTVVDGPDRGREVVARKGVVRVGSSSDNDLVLTDTSVSRRHLEVRLQRDDVRVIDLGSTNGSRVDGVTVFEALLSPSSILRIGDTSIRASAVDEPVVIPLSNRDHFGGLIGRSSAMREVYAILERAAPTDATVLVTGETGTGKEVAAEAIHNHSVRADGPFVAIDCGAIAESLVESQLFGHLKGAFTGAVSDHRGVFEEAHGGTLFLDEIGELPLELQPKLLRVLEKREVRRVGASQTRPVDVRLIAATNRDLREEVNRGTFREDLFFRLNVVEVRLPPLRSRREDIPSLVRHFIERFRPGSPSPSDEMLQAMAAKPWPGNVRELRNAVERALALGTGHSAPSANSGAAAAPRSSSPSGSGMGTSEVPNEVLALPYKEASEVWTNRFERAYLLETLRKSGGSVSGAARIADVNRRFVQRLMRRHGITSDTDEPAED